MIRRHRDLLLVHFPANALLLWLAYEWLGVDESSTGKLLLSTFDALAILTLVCWLYGATMVWFRSPKPKLNDAFRAALGHLGALLGLAVAVLAAYGLISEASAVIGQPALKIASWLTWTLRTPVRPGGITAIFQTVFWLLRWAILPVLLLPVAAGIATQGRAGWRELRVRHPWRQWVLVPLIALATFWLPLLIVNWKPKSGSFGLELASFGIRALIAYGLFVLGNVMLQAFPQHPIHRR